MDEDAKLIYEAYTEGDLPDKGIAASDLVWSDNDELLYSPEEFIKYLDQLSEDELEEMDLERDMSAPRGYMSSHDSLFGTGLYAATGMTGLSHFSPEGELKLDILKGTPVHFRKSRHIQYYDIDIASETEDDDRLRLMMRQISAPVDNIRKYFDLSSSSRARIALKGLR